MGLAEARLEVVALALQGRRVADPLALPGRLVPCPRGERESAAGERESRMRERARERGQRQGECHNGGAHRSPEGASQAAAMWAKVRTFQAMHGDGQLIAFRRRPGQVATAGVVGGLGSHQVVLRLALLRLEHLHGLAELCEAQGGDGPFLVVPAGREGAAWRGSGVGEGVNEGEGAAWGRAVWVS